MLKLGISGKNLGRGGLLLGAISLLNSLLAGAEGSTQEQAGATNVMQTLVVGALGVLMLYFIILRPDQKKRSALQKKRQTLKVGDVVLASAIQGTVVKVDEEKIALKLLNDARVEVPKFAIFEVESENQSGTKASSARKT